MTAKAKRGPQILRSPLLFWGLVLLGLASLPYALSPPPPQAPPDMSDKPGVRLIYRHECGKCHSINGLPEVVGKMGPALDGVGRRAASRRPGLGSRQYLRQSLREPQAYIVEGYLKTMPSYSHLPPAEIDELVEYLEKL